MNDMSEITQLLQNYKDGVPVKIDRGSIVFLCAAALATVLIGAIALKMIKKL